MKDKEKSPLELDAKLLIHGREMERGMTPIYMYAL